MNISKKQWAMIAVGIVALVLVYWFFFRKKKESSYDPNVMIFGNESGYDNEQLDGGAIESGYAKTNDNDRCPPGYTFDNGNCKPIKKAVKRNAEESLFILPDKPQGNIRACPAGYYSAGYVPGKGNDCRWMTKKTT